jgi:hypothetical protein
VFRKEEEEMNRLTKLLFKYYLLGALSAIIVILAVKGWIGVLTPRKEVSPLLFRNHDMYIDEDGDFIADPFTAPEQELPEIDFNKHILYEGSI